MHIAVCDDDIAQRKQTERLLGREADKWIKNGDPVYTYSYGSEESLLANLMQFDAILLDLTQSGDITVKKVIEDLRPDRRPGASRGHFVFAKAHKDRGTP